MNERSLYNAAPARMQNEFTERSFIEYTAAMRRPDIDLQRRRIDGIVEAATACFLDKGFHRTSVQDIARAAGISMGLLYRYFPGKHAIIVAVAERSRRAALDRIAAFAAAADPLADLPRLVADLVRDWTQPGYLPLTAEIWAESFRDPEVRALVRDDIAALRGTLGEAVAAHQRAGRIDAGCAADALAGLILAVVDGLTTGATLDDGAGLDATLAPLRRMAAALAPG